MMKKTLLGLCVALSLSSGLASAADDVIRLGNLKLAHFGAISYIKEIGPKCGIKVEESTFAKGLDVMQAMISDSGTEPSVLKVSKLTKCISIHILMNIQCNK